MRHTNLAVANINTFAQGASSASLVTAADGALFPASVPFWLTVYKDSQYNNPASDPKVEIIRVDAFNQGTGNFTTITRGQVGTSDQDHNEAGGTYTAILAPLAHDQFARYNVKSFGAVGDGTTDDTVAIQAAIDAVTTVMNGTGRGGVVFFPVGSYKTTSVVTVPPAVKLKGESVGSLAPSTNSQLVVHHGGEGYRFLINKSGELHHMGGAENITFIAGVSSSDLKLAVLGDPDNVDSTHGAWDVNFRSCSFSSLIGYGVYAVNADNMLIDNCLFSACQYGVRILHGGRGAVIRDNTFSPIGGTYSTNTVAIHAQQGVASIGRHGMRIEGNRFREYDWPVWITSLKGVAITGNSFDGVDETAVTLSRKVNTEFGEAPDGSGCQGCLVEGNYFRNWSRTASNGVAVDVIHSNQNSIVHNGFDSPNSNADAAIRFNDDTVDNSSEGNIVINMDITNAGTVPLIIDVGSEKLDQCIITRSTIKLIPRDTDPTGLGAGDQGTLWYLDDTSDKLRFWDGSTAADV